MKILVACEYSGIVSAAFRKLGHEVWSCDILDTEGDRDFHFKGDVREMLGQKWDMIIAHPPCTYLCNSGVCWLYKTVSSGTGWPNPVKFTKERNEVRWEQMRQGAEFFNLFQNHPCEKIAIENPIMHKYAREIVGRHQDQVIQPWMFGHPESKATCLWLKGLPLLVGTNNVKEEMTKLPKNVAQRLHNLPPSADRAKLRSKTFQGIADAMAEQWGKL